MISSHCSNIHDDDTDTDYATVSESDDEDNDLCTICHSRDPPSTSRDDLNSTVKWSQCYYCDMWVHNICCPRCRNILKGECSVVNVIYCISKNEV